MTQYKSGTSDPNVAEKPHMDVLIRIKRAVLAGRYTFGKKARIELVIYTKGKFIEAEGSETYYFLVSSKRAM